jgi:hypothetical protein
MSTSSRRGRSVRERRYSKYSPAPRNRREVRAGRTERVSGGGCWLVECVINRASWNSRASSLSLVNVDRQATISSGEMYPEYGIRSRRSVTRSVADKSSFCGAGNEMPCKSSDRRRGVNPPRNESGRTGGHLSSAEESSRDVSAGNGFFIASYLFDSEFGMSQMLISRTRSWHSSAAMMLSIPRSGELGLLWHETTIGSAGQISSIFLAGVLFVQRSRRSSQPGDPNTRYRHLWHTCTSVCHVSLLESSTLDKGRLC